MINLPPIATTITITGLYGLLLFSTLLILLLKRIYPETDFTEVTTRTNSWWVMISLFSLAIILQRGPAIAFLGFISFLAFKEYLSLIPTRRLITRCCSGHISPYLSSFYWVYTYWYGMFIVFIPVWIFLLLPLRMITIGATEWFSESSEHPPLGFDDHRIQLKPCGIPFVSTEN